MSIKTLPDNKLEELLEKYTEKNERYKFFVNEETERTELVLNEIKDEINSRKEFRETLHDIFITK